MSNYWYKFTTHTCPVCGSSKTTKERQTSPKPAAAYLRYTEVDVYDYCQETIKGYMFPLDGRK